MYKCKCGLWIKDGEECTSDICELSNNALWVAICLQNCIDNYKDTIDDELLSQYNIAMKSFFDCYKGLNN